MRAMSVNDLSRGQGVVISGSAGCGKTHVARAIYRFTQSFSVDLGFVRKPKMGELIWSSLWVDWPNIAETDDESNFRDMQHELSQATFVVIDDVGSESDRFKNGVSSSRLRRILSFLQRKWVVMTTNLSHEEFMDCYDARVADRQRGFQWMVMGDVPSYRPKLTT